jgi:hypothetical protein
MAEIKARFAKLVLAYKEHGNSVLHLEPDANSFPEYVKIAILEYTAYVEALSPKLKARAGCDQARELANKEIAEAVRRARTSSGE